MTYQREEFTNEEVYHVILRAIDDNLIFKDDHDYYRGIFSIYEFNNSIPIEIWLRRQQRKKEKAMESLGGQTSQLPHRDVLVDILAFCLMPNHIHLLIKQKIDGGITKFMRKVGTGYAGYFNRKYQRKGHVFQNKFHAVHAKDDDQLKIVFNYIHANPISLIEPNFKEQGIKNHSIQEVMDFLKIGHRWSSYPDYIGIKNFPSTTERDFMNKLFGLDGCQAMLQDWVTYKKDLGEYDPLFLE